MKLRSFSILSLFLCLAMLVAVPNESYGRKKSTKAKTTATTKSSKSSKSKSSKSKSSKYSKSSKSSSASTKSTRRRSHSVQARRYTSSPSQQNYYTDRQIDDTPAVESRTERTSTAKATSSSSGKTQTTAKTESKRKIKVEKPNLEEIRKATHDPKSQYYFPKLMKRYERKDTTMTPEEFRHFYLGYMFQEDYDPYRVSPYSSVTDELRNKPTHTRAEIDTIIKYATLSLEDNPFDLRQMSFLVHVLKERRKDMTAKVWEYRLENLLAAIKSTGTGASADNAWYVMYPVHEYDMVQLLGYEPVDAQFIEPGYDYLVVRPDETDKRKRDKSAKGFYFNVIVPQEQYELKHPEELEDASEEVTAEPAAVKAELEELDPDNLPAE